MVLRLEGATVAQAAEAAVGQLQCSRLLRRPKEGELQVSVSERVRQISSSKAGAKGGYTVYRVADAG
jgi:hypothetical protein